jgi:nuclease S1
MLTADRPNGDRPMRRVVPLILLLPTVAFGWGDSAHGVICQIAFDELTPTARTEVERLINLDPGFSTFADSCTFVDELSRKRPPDNLINDPKSYLAVHINECPSGDTCLSTAIALDLEILADAGSSDADRLQALKLLGHWVGDMHLSADRFYRNDWGGHDINEPVIHCDLHCNHEYLDWITGTNIAVYAAILRREISDDERTLWVFDSPLEWAKEKLDLETITPNDEYITMVQNDLTGPEHIDTERRAAIMEAELARLEKIVHLILKRAGVRLGALLNESLQ